MVYTITWNDGRVDTFPADTYTLRDIQQLRDEIKLATKGFYTGQVDLVEEDGDNSEKQAIEQQQVNFPQGRENSMVYTITWNDGRVDTFPADRYTLKDIQQLRDEIALTTRGGYTGRVDLVAGAIQKEG